MGSEFSVNWMESGCEDDWWSCKEGGGSWMGEFFEK